MNMIEVIDNEHQALASKLESVHGADQDELVSFGRLLGEYLRTEGYIVNMDLQGSPELLVEQGGEGIRAGLYDGVRLRYSSRSIVYSRAFYSVGVQYDVHSIIWWTIIHGTSKLLEALPDILNDVLAKMQCRKCHYSNPTGDYCGKGLVGTGDCNQYREK